MPSSKLLAAVKAVDWNHNVSGFVKSTADVGLLAGASFRLAIWAKQLELIDGNNPAICFVREMQIAAQNTSAALSLGLYKLGAGSMRTMLETVLYYSYFRTHHSELETLVRDAKYYIGKQDVLDFHRMHTPRFPELQAKVDLVGRLNSWYSRISAVVHGQVPGTWIKHTALKDIAYDHAVLKTATGAFVEGEAIVHDFLLVTLGREHWDKFGTTAKTLLLKGLSGEFKALLALDAA